MIYYKRNMLRKISNLTAGQFVSRTKCESKKEYVSKRMADKEADRYLGEFGTISSAYRCKWCKQWHLASVKTIPVSQDKACLLYGLPVKTAEMSPAF